MRQRVLDAVDELGYQPNLLAQSLRWRETLTVGFVVGDISNPLLATIVEGAETTLRDAGYSMLLTNSEGNPGLDAEGIKLFQRRQVDGLILSLARDDHAPTMEVLERVSVPVVMVDRELPPEVPASRVLADHRAGMRTAVEHLVDLGHRRIGLVVGQTIRPTIERVAALEEVFAARGLPPTYRVLRGESMGASWGEEATRRLLDDPEPPSADHRGRQPAADRRAARGGGARRRDRAAPLAGRLRRRRDHGAVPPADRHRPPRQPRTWAAWRRSSCCGACAAARTTTTGRPRS